MSTFRNTVRTASLAILLLFFGALVSAAQDVVVSEYFNTGDPTTEWTEIVVVKDNLNLVGWIVTDNNTEQNEAQGGVKFRDVPLWRNVRAGTIIVIWHRRGSSFTGRDIDPSDGYLEIGRDDGTIVDVAQFGVSPGGPMNIAAGGDFLQVLDADTVHVHGVGHRNPTGPYYDAAARPKANADGSVPNNGSVSVVGSSLAAYDAGITSDSVQITTSASAITLGLPNRFAGTAMTSRNHLLWRRWREPSWSIAAPTLRLVSQTATDQTVEWSAVTDSYPADRVTGVMLLRDTAGFAGFDASSIRDGASFNVGQNVSTALVVAVQPTEAGSRFTDPGVECGKRYWYRAYAYRYAADQRLAVTPDSSARGRQWVTDVWAESPRIDRPLPAKPIIRANATAICPGDTLTLITSSVGTYYEWTVDGQPVTVTGTTRITITQPGRYTLRVTAEGGCQAVSDVFVVNALPAPVVDVTPSGTLTICTGDSVVLTATTPAAVYEWRRNGAVIAGATTSRYTARQAGDYQVRVSSATGCPRRFVGGQHQDSGYPIPLRAGVPHVPNAWRLRRKRHGHRHPRERRRRGDHAFLLRHAGWFFAGLPGTGQRRHTVGWPCYGHHPVRPHRGWTCRWDGDLRRTAVWSDCRTRTRWAAFRRTRQHRCRDGRLWSVPCVFHRGHPWRTDVHHPE